MFGSNPFDELSIPDGSVVEEHDLVTDGDVLVGGQSVIELGVRGANVVAGERVRFAGDLEADGDCRLDMWCSVDGNVLVGEDAYLGERVHITGQLIVSGDLDIGDDVDIERGFEANGWIVIRNPMPTIVFLFIYLSQLLRLGEEEAASEVANEFLADDTDAQPTTIPRGARVSDDAWRVSTPAYIGSQCRLHGNIRAASIDVAADTEVFGSLRARGDIHVGPGTVVHGDVTTKGGDVVVDPGAHVRGDISCEDCALSEAAEVDGSIRARGEMTLTSAPEPVESVIDSDTNPSVNSDADDSASDTGLTPAFVRVDANEESAAPTPAIIPLGDGRYDWETADTRTGDSDSASTDTADADPSTNGASEDLSGIIAEAEKR